MFNTSARAKATAGKRESDDERARFWAARFWAVKFWACFDPAQEKDSCGVGFIADIKGRKSHKIVDDALTILLNLEHRGAVGADPRAGDGAGILVQIPHKFFAKKARELGFTLPEPGHYAVGALFLPHDAEWRAEIMDTYADGRRA